LFYTVLATVPWCIIFVQIGKSLGENWEQIDEKAGPLMHWFLYGAVVLAVVYFIWNALRKRGGRRNGRRSGSGAHGGAKGHGAPDHGYVGEKNTAHQLKFIGSEYRLLHRRRVRARTGTQEFDHLVVGPNGLFHIETKNWGGQIRFTEHGVERDRDGHHEDPTAQLYRHEYVLKELLRAHKLQADVIGVLCFANPDSQVIGKSPAFLTVQLDRLVHEIKSRRAQHPLTSEQVRTIAKLLEDNSEPS
jgi:hypothetical protein